MNPLSDRLHPRQSGKYLRRQRCGQNVYETFHDPHCKLRMKLCPPDLLPQPKRLNGPVGIAGKLNRSGRKLNNNVAIPARVGSWLAGQNQFGIFTEPDPSQLELDGKAFFCASIGETVGPADYTVFCATTKYIEENPQTVQAWTNAIAKAMTWTQSAPMPDLVKVLSPFFPGVSPQAVEYACQRLRRLGMWKKTPVIDEKPMDTFQDILVQGRVLEAAKRVKFADLITNDFARKAKV